MKIATILNVHSDPRLIIDTCDSIFKFVGEDVLLLVNGSSWGDLKDIDLPVYKVRGFRHDVPNSPYRNVALGLKMVQEQWPDADWFCYTEYDVLFASSRFQANLKMAEDKKVWMLGNCGHVDHIEMPLIDAMLEEKTKSVYYLLGCCQFFHRDFMTKLSDIDFFDRFLFLTNSFANGFFPAYDGYDISEHLYPTLCRHFGGNVGVFATWDDKEWHGAHRYFPMRWKPEIDEDFPEASILHPLKSYDHPVRKYHRERREECQNLVQ
jgi:hypothetical protein